MFAPSKMPQSSPPGFGSFRPGPARLDSILQQGSVNIAEEDEAPRQSYSVANVTRKRDASPIPATSTPPAKRVAGSSPALVTCLTAPEVLTDDEQALVANTVIGDHDIFVSDASSPIPAPAAAARDLWRAKVDAALKDWPPRDLVVHTSKFVGVKTTVVDKLSLKQGAEEYDGAIHIIEQQLLFWAETFGSKGIVRLTEFAQSLHDKEKYIATPCMPVTPPLGEETIKDLILLRTFIIETVEMSVDWCRATAQLFKMFERFKAAESKKPFPAETREIIRTIILGVNPGLGADTKKLKAARQEFSLEIHFGLTLAHIQKCFGHGAFALLPHTLQEDTLSRSGAEQRIARIVTIVLAEQAPVLAKVCKTIADNLIIPITKGLKPKKICALLPKYDMEDASIEYLAQAQDDVEDGIAEQDASIGIEDSMDADSSIPTPLPTKSQDPQRVAGPSSPTKESEGAQDALGNPQRSLIAASTRLSPRKANTESKDDVMPPPVQLPSGKILSSSNLTGLDLRRKVFAPLPDNLTRIECLLASVKDDSSSPRVSPKITPHTKITATAEEDEATNLMSPSKSTFTAAHDNNDEKACQIQLIEDPEDDDMVVPERKRRKPARKDSPTTPQMSSINGPDLFSRLNSSSKSGKVATQPRGRKGHDVLKNINLSQSTTKRSTPTQYDIWKNIDIPQTTVQCTGSILTTPK